MTTATSSTSNDYTQYVTSSSSSSSSSSSATDSSSVSTAYATFLKLLTTQLQNQNPLDPTDTTQMTTEMIQLSGVEQQLKANDTLSSISSDLSSITMANGIGYIGKTITAAGDTVPIQDGSCDWNYVVSSTAYAVKLEVVDSDGDTVYSTTGDATSGTHSFSWDGKTTDGSTVSSGDYTLKVSAYDSEGTAVNTATQIIGVVTGVDSSSGTTELKIGDVDVALSDVSSLTN